MLHYDIFPNLTDTLTLLPFLETYPHDLKTVVADAGYGSEENLLKLDEVGISHYIKYNQFDREQKRSFKKKAVDWNYDEETDVYQHPDGFVYPFSHTKYRKTASGFEQEIKVYRAEEPEVAPQKGMYINERYRMLKQKESQALLSDQGRTIFGCRVSLWSDKGLFGLHQM